MLDDLAHAWLAINGRRAALECEPSELAQQLADSKFFDAISIQTLGEIIVNYLPRERLLPTVYEAMASKLQELGAELEQDEHQRVADRKAGNKGI